MDKKNTILNHRVSCETFATLLMSDSLSLFSAVSVVYEVIVLVGAAVNQSSINLSASCLFPPEEYCM